MNQPARAIAGDRRAPSRGEVQRGLIIDAVVDLLETVPISELSVQRIAKHAGVTRPAFYFYFESKYSVVAAALAQVWTDIEAATTALDTFDPTISAAEFSSRQVDLAIGVWRANSALLNACLHAYDSDAQLATMWDDFVGRLSSRLAIFAGRLRDEGLTNPASDDLPALIEALVGMTIWFLLNEGRRPGSKDRQLAAIKAIWLAAAWGSPRTA